MLGSDVALADAIVRVAEVSLEVGPILVMNADLLTNLNFENLIEFHNEKRSDATICAESTGSEM